MSRCKECSNQWRWISIKVTVNIQWHMQTVLFVRVKIIKNQSRQLALKTISVGVVWELPISCIISHIVSVWWGFFFPDVVIIWCCQVQNAVWLDWPAFLVPVQTVTYSSASAGYHKCEQGLIITCTRQQKHSVSHSQRKQIWKRTMGDSTETIELQSFLLAAALETRQWNYLSDGEF